MNLEGRVGLVTGGAHRVGKAIAIHLAKMGAEAIVFTYNSSEEKARATEQELQAMGCEAMAIRCDQSDVAQITATIETIMKKFGRLDVLVNSASIFLSAEFLDVTVEDWDRVMDINARGPFFFMQAAARAMLQNDGGVIINIVDESIKKPALSWIHHGASKAALSNLTKSGAISLAPKIRVNAVLPGAVLRPPDWDPERWESATTGIPLQKSGSPKDVCKAIEFLLVSDFVTGHTVVVDGGTTAL